MTMSDISKKISQLSKSKLDEFDADASTWLIGLEDSYESVEDFGERFFDNLLITTNGPKYIGERVGDWSLFFEYLTGQVADGNEDPRAILMAATSRGVNPSDSAIKFIKHIAEEGY
jgi:hypothetical protein